MAASALYRRSDFFDDKRSEESFDLNLCHSVPRYSTVKNNNISSSNLDEKRSSKRLKQAPSSDGFLGSKSTHCRTSSNSRSTISLNGLPIVPFGDYESAYAEGQLAIEAMVEASAMMVGGERCEVRGQVGADEMKLIQQLIACAEAVACRDKAYASALLSELRSNALVFGTSFQRVASCFVQGLAERLTLVQPLGEVGALGSNPQSVAVSAEKDEALGLLYEICPQIQFGHFIANASILETIEGESSVHVVDLGMTLGLPHGQQWLRLIHSLANNAGQPPYRLRITGVGQSADRLQATGNEIERYAQSLGVSCEFSSVNSSLENLTPEDFYLHDGEVVVINSILQLHCAVKESRGALKSVLQMLRKLSPRLLILVEQDSSHNGPFFLGKFMEALHYYSAIFDSLDAILPKYDVRRAKIEQFYFAEEIKNIISSEGSARVERHERADQWRRRMGRAGLQPKPIRMMTRTKDWLRKLKAFEGYNVAEERGCLILGWKAKPIVAASCWKCC